MSTKNIIIYSKGLPPESVGGVETNAWHLIRHLANSKEFNIAVVSQCRAPKLLWRLLTRQKEVDYAGIKARTFYQKKRAFKKLDQVSRLLDAIGFDANETLIFHNTFDLHPHFQKLHEMGFSQVARSGGNDIFFMQKTAETGKNILESIQYLDKIFVNSRYSHARSQEAQIPEHMLEIVIGGCEIPPEPNPQKTEISSDTPPTVIACGRLVDFKGLDDALNAFSMLKQRGIHFRFLIVGDGELRQSLEKQTCSLGISDNCKFIGQVPPDKVDDFYRQADIYLSTSKGVYRERKGRRYLHTETMGRSLCEAQAHGIPVVATNTGGVSEVVIDSTTGIVVEEGKPDQIATALERLITNPELRTRMAEQARRHATDNLSWGSVFSRYLSAIRALERRSQQHQENYPPSTVP